MGGVIRLSRVEEVLHIAVCPSAAHRVGGFVSSIMRVWSRVVSSRLWPHHHINAKEAVVPTVSTDAGCQAI